MMNNEVLEQWYSNRPTKKEELQNEINRINAKLELLNNINTTNHYELISLRLELRRV